MGQFSKLVSSFCIWSSPKLAHPSPSPLWDTLGRCRSQRKQTSSKPWDWLIGHQNNASSSAVQCYPTEGKHGQATSLLAFDFFWFSDLIPTRREETRKGLESPWEHPELPLCPFWGWTTASCDLCRRASQVGHFWSDKRVRCCAARIQFYLFAMLFPLTLTAISHHSIVYSHRDFCIK